MQSDCQLALSSAALVFGVGSSHDPDPDPVSELLQACKSKVAARDNVEEILFKLAIR